VFRLSRLQECSCFAYVAPTTILTRYLVDHVLLLFNWWFLFCRWKLAFEGFHWLIVNFVETLFTPTIVNRPIIDSLETHKNNNITRYIYVSERLLINLVCNRHVLLYFCPTKQWQCNRKVTCPWLEQ
jgi:hypothetical protein